MTPSAAARGPHLAELIHARRTPLGHRRAPELYALVARLDAQLGALHGAQGERLARGAAQVGDTLGRMVVLARTQGVVPVVREAVERRRDALARLAAGLGPEGEADEQTLEKFDRLRAHIPGLDRIFPPRKTPAEPDSPAEALWRALRFGHAPRTRGWFDALTHAGPLPKANPALGFSLLGQAASSAWNAGKQKLAEAKRWMQTPEGQLLATGLSLATTLVPVGAVVKGIVGGTMGALEAVARGGDLKQVLVGAAAGAVEAVVPVSKLGALAKLGVGAVKGGLVAAADGREEGPGVLKGAALGAFDLGGAAVLKKYAGGKLFASLGTLLEGGSARSGVLGKLQAAARGKSIQSLLPKAKKAGLWVSDKAHLAHGKLRKSREWLGRANRTGDLVKGALGAVESAAGAAAERRDDGSVKAFLQTLSQSAKGGGERMKDGLEWSRKVEYYGYKTEVWLGRAMALAPPQRPASPSKALTQSQEAKAFGQRKPETRAQKKGWKGASRAAWAQAGLYERLLWADRLVDKGLVSTKKLRDGLRNVVLMTEEARDDSYLRRLHDVSARWEGGLSGLVSGAEKVRGSAALLRGGLHWSLETAPDGLAERAEARVDAWFASETRKNRAAKLLNPAELRVVSRAREALSDLRRRAVTVDQHPRTGQMAAMTRLLGAFDEEHGKDNRFDLGEAWKAYGERHPAAAKDQTRPPLAPREERALEPRRVQAVSTRLMESAVTDVILQGDAAAMPPREAVRAQVEAFELEVARQSPLPFTIVPPAHESPESRVALERRGYALARELHQLAAQGFPDADPLGERVVRALRRLTAPLGGMRAAEPQVLARAPVPCEPEDSWMGSGASAQPLEFGEWIQGAPRPRTRSGRSGRASSQRMAARRLAEAPRRLDFAVLTRMERFLGGRLSGVRIHTGKAAQAIARRFDAEAVTIGEHVFFAAGRYQPHSTEGRKLIAHELTHVLQRGRPNLDTRTAEAEAHLAESAFGTPGMEVLDLAAPGADFRLPGGGPMPAGMLAAKTSRPRKDPSVSSERPTGEALLDQVGERVYELMVEELREAEED